MAVDKRSASDFSQDPLISIITPVLNGQDLLENHIRMVQSQTYANKEHIIIDGGSSDHAPDILKSKNDAVAYWVSEKDRGIYDAMNKGIDAARGRWLFFSGVDDHFLNHQSLEQVFKSQKIEAAAQLICGNVIRSDGRLVRSRFNRSLYFKNTLPHQGVFYRRDIFDNYRYGGFKRKPHHFYNISGDYHLNLYLFMKGAVHQSLDCTIMRCGHGRSMAGDFTGYLEEIIIRHCFIGHSKSLVFDFMTLLRYVRRFFLGKLNQEYHTQVI